MFCLIAVVSRILLHFVLFVVPGSQYSINSLNSPFDIASIALQTNGKKKQGMDTHQAEIWKEVTQTTLHM